MESETRRAKIWLDAGVVLRPCVAHGYARRSCFSTMASSLMPTPMPKRLKSGTFVEFATDLDTTPRREDNHQQNHY